MAATGEEGHQLRLSDLPDEILIHILSMLPTEFAVRTCLLLRSWQHLWKSLTRLEFHFHESERFISRGFDEDEMFKLKPFHEQRIIREQSDRTLGNHFMNFVDRVMGLRDQSSPLVSFSLQYFVVEGVDGNRIKTWITKAVQCNVEELTLSLDNLNDMDDFIPCCLFGCQSLVKLTFCLGSNLYVPYEPLICLPGLKYLRIEGANFTNCESIKKLLSSPLPELEELILERCYYIIKEPLLRVCLPKLQILEIHDPWISWPNKIHIIGDNLKSFSYLGSLHYEYEICASSSTQLTKVEIYVTKFDTEDSALNCYTILKGLHGTRNLALSDYFLKGLEDFPELLDTIPTFDCLTRLDIRVFMEWISIDNLAIMKIYERCPYLEYLNIGKLSRTGGSLQLSPLPLCFQTHLKKILVHYYVPGDEAADAAIDVLLNSALVLEELVIYCRRDEVNGFHEGGRKIQELQDKFNRRPRVSKDCIISVRLTYYIDRSGESFEDASFEDEPFEESEEYYHNCYLYRTREP